MKTFTKKNILYVLIVAFVTVAVIRLFVFEAFFVRGESMHPTLQSGDFVLVNKLSYINGEPERGDIIVAIPRTYAGRVVKRVIGLPGEWFAIENNRVVIRNSRTDKGVNLDEAYLEFPDTDAIGKSRTNIDPREYFALGDNRKQSIDSRELGLIDLDSIQGRVFGVFRIKAFKYIGF